MFKLKGKTLFLFAVIAIGLISVGIYFYTSLNSLNKRVEQGTFPQRTSNYLKDITLNVNKLNNLYLVDSIKFSSRQVDTIITRIEADLDSIKIQFKNTHALDEKKIDTIPRLLRAIQKEYLELEEIRQESQSRFLNDLESLLIDELADLNLNQRDSITIIRQITSEIYERSKEGVNFLENIDIESEKRDNRSFFQRIFGSSSTASTEEKEPNSKEEEYAKSAIQQSELDTLISTRVDTLLSQSKRLDEQPTELKIISIFERIQMRRIRMLESLKEKETLIFQKNYEVNNYIENILNDILYEEVNAFNTSIEDFSKKSRRYLLTSGIIILSFIVLALISAYIVIRDINRSMYYQKKLEASERRALREAEEKQKFLSTMSHELRTPLTSIIGFTELLDQNEENVKAIKTASNYLYQMTNEILDMAKIKAGIFEIKKEAFNLNEVFQLIEANFKTLIQNQGLSAEFSYPDFPVYVFSDQYRLQQILYNLVHNALKYTEEGHIKVGYTQTSEEDSRQIYVTIFIEDTGVGMTAEEQVSIFKDYQQAGTHKNKMKGTGLGMGIVKNLVQKLGGKLSLKSEVEQGTSFTIDFQLTQANLADIQRNKDEEITLAPNALQNYSIFVVDDDVLITQLYQRIFEQLGANISLMNSSVKAFEHLKEKRDYDLVIFDMKMPEMTGSDLLKALEEAGAKPKITVICTANVLLSEEDKEAFEAFDYSLFKPVKKKDITRLLLDAFQLNTTSKKVTNENLIKSEKAISDQLSYSLEDLKEYIGDDEEALYEMLVFLLEENQVELNLLENALASEDLEETANRIHKLSSRFAQLRIEAPHNPKEVELALRGNNKDFLTSASEIFIFWKESNYFLLKKYSKS